MSAFFDEVHRRYGDPKAFIRSYRHRMRLHGISQAQIAARSGFLAVNVSYWLGKSARRVPSMESMVVLDEALEQLIKGET